MGANGAYDKSYGGIPDIKRTHQEVGYRIDGHKILIQKDNPGQKKTPMNSNSESPIYLTAKVNKRGEIVIGGIGIYKDHKIETSIDLKFDKDGNIIPFKKGENTSHFHKWEEKSNGKTGRDRHKDENCLPVPKEYEELIKKIEKFNKEKHKWKQNN